MRPAAVVLATVIACSLVVSGCGSSRSAGPYAPITEKDRDEAGARRLNAQAAKLIDSDPAKAEALLREALTADIFAGPAHNNLGIIYLKRSELYSAASEFEWAAKLIPGAADPRMNLALTLERAGRTDEALKAYATALEVCPDHLRTVEAMTRLQVKSGRTDERTRRMLEEVSMRGEDERWRQWARGQLSRISP